MVLHQSSSSTLCARTSRLRTRARLSTSRSVCTSSHSISTDIGIRSQPSRAHTTTTTGVLDVDISSRLILDKVLGITDLRSDKRIDFVGGLRGLEELKRRVDSGEMRMALALYPVSMKQIIDIADSGKIMPPKATWFEPKLRSGLIIHKLS